MRSGLCWLPRALAVAAVLVLASGTAASAASQAGDTSVARSGVLVASDFPAGFTASAASTKTHADTIRLAKLVDGCAPYISLQKAVTPLPQAKSPRFGDGARDIGNEVDVFPTERGAAAALVMYSKPSVVGCLEHLFEKQTRLDPSQRGSLDDVVVKLDRQDIAGLGDDSVVYEGNLTLTGTDGSTRQLRIGSAVVRVGRVVDVVTYTTTGDSLTDVLASAIDSSVARLRSALTRNGA
jgi:hypothetical protein